jgi:hypothetical protein
MCFEKLYYEWNQNTLTNKEIMQMVFPDPMCATNFRTGESVHRSSLSRIVSSGKRVFEIHDTIYALFYFTNSEIAYRTDYSIKFINDKTGVAVREIVIPALQNKYTACFQYYDGIILITGNNFYLLNLQGRVLFSWNKFPQCNILHAREKDGLIYTLSEQQLCAWKFSAAI